MAGEEGKHRKHEDEDNQRAFMGITIMGTFGIENE